MTPEEKLLRAIFGEKASDVRDTSLRMAPGDSGTVVEVRVFNRHGVDKDERALQIEQEEIERLARDREDEVVILDRNIYARLREVLRGKTAVKGPRGVKAGAKLSEETLAEIIDADLWKIVLGDDAQMMEMEQLQEPVRGRQAQPRSPLRGQGRERCAAATICRRAS